MHSKPSRPTCHTTRTFKRGAVATAAATDVTLSRVTSSGAGQRRSVKTHSAAVTPDSKGQSVPNTGPMTVLSSAPAAASRRRSTHMSDNT
jgi:hypothetical protein